MYSVQEYAADINPLVRQGIISSDLFDVCVPPLNTSNHVQSTAGATQSTRHMWRQSRLLTGAHINNDHTLKYIKNIAILALKFNLSQIICSVYTFCVKLFCSILLKKQIWD